MQRLRQLIPELKKRATYIGSALSIVRQAAGGWTLAWIVALVIQGLVPAGIVYLTKLLIDAIADAVGAGVSTDVILSVLWPTLAMVGLLLLQQVLGSLVEWINTAQTELVQDHMKRLIHSKAVEVDFEFYENSEYYDRLEQANTQATQRSLALLQNIGGILQGLVTLLSISVILLTYSVLLPLVLLVSTLPALYVVVKHNQIHHDWWNRTTADRRWAYYFDTLLTVHRSAAEVRIFNLGKFFSTSYQDIRRRLRTERLRLLRSQTVARFGAGLIALGITGAVMAWIGLRALRGVATLGDIGLFYQAFNQGQSLMRSLLSNAGQMYTNTLFLEHLFVLLKQEPRITDPAAPRAVPAPLQRSILFRNITFRYPGSERPALENFSLEIPAGKTIAIVGANGAGKSTLTKLLCRFYDPQEGSVEFDGIDIRHFTLEELRRQISIMFQMPVQYQAIAADNIGYSVVEHDPAREQIVEASKGAGAHEFIERLHKGYDTLLGRLFSNGTELSGGEWQRVALARAFLRQGQIVVLDEPTSSMDSWAENEWLKRFRDLVEDRTAIIITHRFTTAMQADIIHVMENGQVVETGTHTELLERGGRYASSWYEQMRVERSSSPAVVGLDGTE